jgi:hypothetical protein
MLVVPDYCFGMFLFFSNRAGCVGSLLVSAAVTLLIFLVFAR